MFAVYVSYFFICWFIKDLPDVCFTLVLKSVYMSPLLLDSFVLEYWLVKGCYVWVFVVCALLDFRESCLLQWFWFCFVLL